MNKQQKIITSIVGITIVLLALLGITYAYYLTRIEGNTNTNSISITTADLKLKYDDGNGLVTKENIMPGTTIEKTFTVTNDGNNKVDNYAVYLEEIINTLSRTEDLTYVLECTSTSGTCSGGSGEFPQLAGILVTNSIDTEVTHTYTLTVTYKNEENIDQSIDMGSKISAFVQIYAMKDVLDIEGEVSGTEEGDYAQINSVRKRSQIVNGKYKFAGVLPGTHTIKICSKDDINCDSPKLTKEIVVNLGAEAKVDDNTITITDDSQTATININLSAQVEENKVTIGSSIKEYNPFNKGTLAYNILNNALNPTSSTSTIYSKNPLTQPGKESTREDERTLSTTEDDYGTSYYFRGNVEDNYVQFNNMCWRIVRIEGDGSVKLTLAKQDLCSTITESDTTSAFIGQSYNSRTAYLLGIYYELEEWFNEKFSQEKIEKTKSSNVCFGDLYTMYDLVEYRVESSAYEEGYFEAYDYNFENYMRIFKNSTANPTLICPGGLDEGYQNSGYVSYLLSLDELVLAGAYKGGTHYLIDNAKDNWFSTSVTYTEGNNANFDYEYVGAVDSNGKLINIEFGYLRPSISLISGIKNSDGDGTINNPYVIN